MNLPQGATRFSALPYPRDPSSRQLRIAACSQDEDGFLTVQRAYTLRQRRNLTARCTHDLYNKRTFFFSTVIAVRRLHRKAFKARGHQTDDSSFVLSFRVDTGDSGSSLRLLSRENSSQSHETARRSRPRQSGAASCGRCVMMRQLRVDCSVR